MNKYNHYAQIGSEHINETIAMLPIEVRVPLHQTEIIKPEVVTKITELWKNHARILHTQNATGKIELIQYAIEAITLLREPVEILIKRAKEFSLQDRTKMEKLIKLHFGKRYAERVRRVMNTTDIADNEINSLWALYNAMTYVASHDEEIEASSRETLLNKSAELLLVPFRGVENEITA